MKFAKFLLLPIASLALSGCFLINSSSGGAQGDKQKTALRYDINDYSDNNVYNTPNCPTTGSVNLLIIPVWFTDSSTYLKSDSNKSYVAEDIDRAFFGSDTGWHSVSSYYYEESGQQLDLAGTVSDWYECGYSSSQAGQSQNVTLQIVQNATDWYFETYANDSRRNYDSDGDGYIDAVSLIYAAPNYMSLNNTRMSNLWAYCYWLQTTRRNIISPTPNTFFWASYDFMYSSSNARSRTGSTYGYGSTDGLSGNNPVDTHTMIHEFGHVLGLDFDYYDYSYQYCPAGGFSMQDYNVGGHDPYSTMAFGWTDPYIPTETCSITIGAFQTTHDVILLTPEWNDYDSPFDEYLLIELYTPTGLNELDCNYQYAGAYPQGPRRTGIRLWHVDARLAMVSKSASSVTPDGTKTTSNPLVSTHYVTKAFTNTYWEEDGEDNGYCSIFGQDYSDYNHLQLIRNDTRETYRSEYLFSEGDLFSNGSSFSMSRYSSQFVNGANLNKGVALGWSFSVSISGSGSSATATINLTKE